MYTVKIYINYKESIVDPSAEAVKGAVKRIGYNEIKDIRQGKYFEITLDKSAENIEETIEDLCKKLLANEVMESYHYEITEAE